MHLRWGTQLENSADAVSDGAISHGEDHYRAHLTNEQAIEIASLKGIIRNKDVAETFDIGTSHVSAIWNGRAWSQVTGIRNPKRATT